MFRVVDPNGQPVLEYPMHIEYPRLALLIPLLYPKTKIGLQQHPNGQLSIAATCVDPKYPLKNSWYRYGARCHNVYHGIEVLINMTRNQ